MWPDLEKVRNSHIQFWVFGDLHIKTTVNGIQRWNFLREDRGIVVLQSLKVLRVTKVEKLHVYVNYANFADPVTYTYELARSDFYTIFTTSMWLIDWLFVNWLV